MNDSNVLAQSNRSGVKASFSSEGFTASAVGDVDGNTATITTYLTMNGKNNMFDLEAFLKLQEDHSVRIPVLCEIKCEGEYTIPYATMSGYHVSNSSEKLAAYGYNLANIPKTEKEEFAYTTFAMIPGKASRFYLMLCADDIIQPDHDDTDTITYFDIGIPGFDVSFNWSEQGNDPTGRKDSWDGGTLSILLDKSTSSDVYTYLADVAEEVFAGAPDATSDAVTVAESKYFTLSKPLAVYWRIKDVKLRGETSADCVLSAEMWRVHPVDLAGMNVSVDENVDTAEL